MAPGARQLLKNAVPADGRGLVWLCSVCHTVPVSSGLLGLALSSRMLIIRKQERKRSNLFLGKSHGKGVVPG